MFIFNEATLLLLTMHEMDKTSILTKVCEQNVNGLEKVIAEVQ